MSDLFDAVCKVVVEFLLSLFRLVIGYFARYTGSEGSRFLRCTGSGDSFNGGRFDSLYYLIVIPEFRRESNFLEFSCLNGEFFGDFLSFGVSPFCIERMLEFTEDRSISFFISEILLVRLC